MGQPVTHMRLINGKPQQVNEPINWFPTSNKEEKTIGTSISCISL